ncbi:unnamed protein product [Brachionus calyciflorus]|uniref:Uncharacterized protein n=1 Tax=Brachionus calyciflorus TaxID=104777 RepID=A0A814CE74_9BILA|nr:unnamed protein product [Brachionus calyciflorus]
MAAQKVCEYKQVPLEVRVEPRPGMRNVTRMGIEEWVWRNGGQQRGGLLRCRFVERRTTTIIFMAMVEVQQNQWLLEMVRTTSFDGQLMVCGPENFTSCWVPLEPQPKRAAQVDQNSPILEQVNPEPIPAAAAAAPAPVVLRPNVTINLNADRILRGIIGSGRMMRQLQGTVPNPDLFRAASPVASEDEEQAFVEVVAELNEKFCYLYCCVILPRTSGAVLPWRGSNVTQSV